MFFNRGIDKDEVQITIVYYSEKKYIMPLAAAWADVEIAILSEVSQTQKDKYYMTSIICGI